MLYNCFTDFSRYVRKIKMMNYYHKIKYDFMEKNTILQRKVQIYGEKYESTVKSGPFTVLPLLYNIAVKCKY